jgi:hypothetical protein
VRRWHRCGAAGRGGAAALLALALACGADRLEAARARGVAYFASEVRSSDPSWSPLFGYLHRRFGLEVRLSTGELAHEPARSGRRPELAVLYERLRDPMARVDPAVIARIPNAVDRMTAAALHCDRVRLPADWVDVLGAAARAGGYALTHSVLAAQWTLENGCRTPAELAALHREQTDLLVRLVEEPGAATERHEAPTDLWLEALVMLHYAGERARVRPEWIEALLEAQLPDGGWPRHPRDRRSDPHPTALALWVLLETIQPEAPPVSWIRRPNGGTDVPPARNQSSALEP